MNTDSTLDLTQSEDNTALELQMLTSLTVNPVLCLHVTPKRNETNSLKVEKDTTLTKDFLSRGDNGFKHLANHLQDDILSKCEQFIPILQKAYVSSIRLYHMQYTSRSNWNSHMYNLELPDINKYLKGGCYFATVSDDQKERLTQGTRNLIQTFSMAMFTLHEKTLTDHATNEYLHMLTVYATFQSWPQQAAYCDAHALKTLPEKEDVLRAFQTGLNQVCRFAFPLACKTCSNLLDDIMRLQEFEEGEAHQVQITLPNFNEELLFQRLCPLPAVAKPDVANPTGPPTGQLPGAKAMTPKTKVSDRINHYESYSFTQF